MEQNDKIIKKVTGYSLYTNELFVVNLLKQEYGPKLFVRHKKQPPVACNWTVVPEKLPQIVHLYAINDMGGIFRQLHSTNKIKSPRLNANARENKFFIKSQLINLFGQHN